MKFYPDKKLLAKNLIASLFIFLFVYTGLTKFINIESFKTALGSSSILKPVAGILSFAVPLTELAISTLLFIPVSRRIGFLCSMILMGLFSVYIMAMLLFASELPCSCGGIIQQMNWTQHLIFNIVFTILGFTGWILSKKHNKDLFAISRQSRIPV